VEEKIGKKNAKKWVGGTNERRELEVVSDEDERIRETKRTKADWKGDLRSFIDDAVVELPASEDGTEKIESSQRTRARRREMQTFRTH